MASITWMSKPRFEIAVVLPSRGRTDMLYRSIMSLVDKAKDISKIQILIGQDNDDVDTIKWTHEVLFKELDERGIHISLLEFDRLGYTKLNEYVNNLAAYSHAEWILFWNDDAIMETQDWDDEIIKYTGKFRVLRMKTHNEHPYAIFPIIPRDWMFLFGYLSLHSLNDAWISQIAYLVNIMETIPVEITHDRYDLTGNNKDDTFEERIVLEGNVDNPLDFNYAPTARKRFMDAQKLAWFLKQRGEDMSWFQHICDGTQDPWERMLSPEFDPNEQVKKYPRPEV